MRDVPVGDGRRNVDPDSRLGVWTDVRMAIAFRSTVFGVPDAQSL